MLIQQIEIIEVTHALSKIFDIWMSDQILDVNLKIEQVEKCLIILSKSLSLLILQPHQFHQISESVPLDHIFLEIKTSPSDMYLDMQMQQQVHETTEASKGAMKDIRLEQMFRATNEIKTIILHVNLGYSKTFKEDLLFQQQVTEDIKNSNH